MAKSSAYAAKETSDEIELLSDKLSADLRRSIRQLGNYAIFSEMWNSMADTFGRVAMISDMESKLPASKKDGATLWETEELALRYLLEDGKLNLTLRNLMEYKHNQQLMYLEAKASGTPLHMPDKSDMFEKGVGVVLRNAWNHVEVIQTTDLPSLINYIADVLLFSVDNPEFPELFAGDLHQRQDVMVFYYLHGLLKHIEDIGEHRVMPISRSRNIFMLGVRWLVAHHAILLSTHVLQIAETLAMFVDTEDFATYKNKYIENIGHSQALQSLKTDCLSAFQSDFDARRKFRKLVDAADQAKRKYGTK